MKQRTITEALILMRKIRVMRRQLQRERFAAASYAEVGLNRKTIKQHLADLREWDCRV